MSYAKPLRPGRDTRDPDSRAAAATGFSTGFSTGSSSASSTGSPGGASFGTVDGAAARAMSRPAYEDYVPHGEHAAHDEDEDGVDWGRVGVFGAGIAIGAVLGAGLAMLYAPQSGAATRRAISRKALDIREDARDRWDELGDRLEMLRRRTGRGRRRLGRTLGRKMQRGRWALEDARED